MACGSKFEVTFRTLVHLLGGFAYRFWTKTMEPAPTWPTNLNVADYPDEVQARLWAKVEAFERFVNLNAIALGVLQILTLELPTQIWAHFSPVVSDPAEPWLSQRTDCPTGAATSG